MELNDLISRNTAIDAMNILYSKMDIADKTARNVMEQVIAVIQDLVPANKQMKEEENDKS